MLRRRVAAGFAFVSLLSVGGLIYASQWAARQRGARVQVNFRRTLGVSSFDRDQTTGDRSDSTFSLKSKYSPMNQTENFDLESWPEEDQMPEMDSYSDYLPPKQQLLLKTVVESFVPRHSKEPTKLDEYYESLLSRDNRDFASFYQPPSSSVSFKDISRYRTLWKNEWLTLSEKGTEAFAKRPLHELSSIEPYRTRRETVRKNCQRLSRSRHINLSRMVYDDVHKMIMCVIPKNACSSWKRFLFYLTGKEKNAKNIPSIPRQQLVLGAGPLPTLNRLDKVEAVRRLATYTTFVVTRHPYERLVSAHSSKFTDRSPKSSYKLRIGRWIAARQAPIYMRGISINGGYGRNGRFLNASVVASDPIFKQLKEEEQRKVLDYVKILRSGKITFLQFLRFITAFLRREPEFMMDVHWRPQVSLCNPCAVNYDYVINFDDLAKDSNRLLEFVQRNEPEQNQIRFDNSTSPVVTNDKAMNLFRNLSQEVLSYIKKIYSGDFSTFGFQT